MPAISAEAQVKWTKLRNDSRHANVIGTHYQSISGSHGNVDGYRIGGSHGCTTARKNGEHVACKVVKHHAYVEAQLPELPTEARPGEVCLLSFPCYMPLYPAPTTTRHALAYETYVISFHTVCASSTALAWALAWKRTRGEAPRPGFPFSAPKRRGPPKNTLARMALFPTCLPLDPPVFPSRAART